MTVWRHAISWSKLKLALDCPLALQFTIDKKPHPRSMMTPPQAKGTVVQFIFEQYFNQGINLKPGGQDRGTMEKIIERILSSKFFETTSAQISYPHNKTEEDFKEEVRAQTLTGFDILKDMKLTTFKVRSEVKLNGVFRGFRMFAMVDFLREGQSGDFLFDGKGHAREDADPRQVVYYALNRAASGRKIAGGGLIYWNHGFRKVDVSPAALKAFVENEFAEVRPIFDELKAGTNREFEARPEYEKCRKCNWRNICEHSAAARPPMQEGLPERVSFDSQAVEV